MKSVRLERTFDFNEVLRAYKNSYQINDKLKADITLDSVNENKHCIHSVYINDKLVGFSVNPIDHERSVGVYVYTLPGFNPFDTLPLFYAASIVAINICQDNDCDYIEFDTWHDFLVDNIIKFVPNINVFRIRKGFIYFSLPSKDIAELNYESCNVFNLNYDELGFTFNYGK